MFPLPVLIQILRLVVSFWWWCYRKSSASGVVQWENCEADGDGFFFLTPDSPGCQFYDLLHAFTPVFFFIGLKLHFTSKFTVDVNYIHVKILFICPLCYP